MWVPADEPLCSAVRPPPPALPHEFPSPVRLRLGDLPLRDLAVPQALLAPSSSFWEGLRHLECN